MRNTHFYEMALIGPGMPNAVPPVYTCGYSDQPEDARRRRLRARCRTGPASASPTTGTFIEKNRRQHHVFARD